MILRYKAIIISLMLLITSVTLLKAQITEKDFAKARFGLDNSLVGKPIKPFSMVTYEGKPLISEQLKGKVIVLDFWATWCGPCRKLTTELDSALKPYYTRDFLMIGVNYMENRRAGNPVAYWKQHNYQFPMTLNNDAYGNAVNAGNPVVMVIDQQGIVRGKWEAWTPTRAAEIEALVWSLMDKPVVSMQAIIDKNRAREYEKALWLHEALMQKDSADKDALQQEKLLALLHLNQEEAMDFAKDWRGRTNDTEQVLTTVCAYFTETENLFPNAYAYAAKAFETLIAKYPANADSFITTDYMSRCYYRAGDKTTAIKLAEKSIALAKSQNAPQATTEYLQHVLEKYKQGLIANAPVQATTPHSFELTGTGLLPVGSKAPVIDLQDINGKTVSLEQFKGKTIILDVWATWCVPCRAELPALDSLAATYAAKDVVMIAVCSADSKTNFNAFIKNYKAGFKCVFWFDPLGVSKQGNSLRSVYGINGFPTTMVINKRGIISGYGLNVNEIKVLTTAALK